MKRLSILLLSMLCTAATAFVYDFQSGDLYYNITSDTTGTVSEKGAEKLLRNGQVLILHNGETYDMMGQRL